MESEVKELQEFETYTRAARHEYDELQRVFMELQDFKISVFKNKDVTEEDRKAIEKKREETNEQFQIWEQKGERKEMEVMKNMPITVVWLERLEQFSYMANYNKQAKEYREDVVALYNRLTEEQKATEIGKKITAYLFPPTTVQIGDDMADADLYDLEGNLHHLSELKGKYILLDFWSRGCGPCIMAMPEMKEVTEKYKDKLSIVSLSTDSEKHWRAASEEHQMTWHNWSDKKQTHGLYLKYDVRSIPHYVLISPEGKVIHTSIGYGKGSLHKLLEEFIKANL